MYSNKTDDCSILHSRDTRESWVGHEARNLANRFTWQRSNSKFPHGVLCANMFGEESKHDGDKIHLDS
jgi:hypothetical protein